LTNTPQFAPPGVTVGAPDFGQVNGTRFNDSAECPARVEAAFPDRRPSLGIAQTIRHCTMNAPELDEKRFIPSHGRVIATVTS